MLFCLYYIYNVARQRHQVLPEPRSTNRETRCSSLSCGERAYNAFARRFNLQLEVMASNSSLFPSFLDTTSSQNSLGGAPRLAPSPMAQQQQNANGNGNGMNGMPVMAGQQMDVNLLYQKVVELSEVLKENRERTQGIVNGAEDLAVSIFAGSWIPRLRCFSCQRLIVSEIASLLLRGNG